VLLTQNAIVEIKEQQHVLLALIVGERENKEKGSSASALWVLWALENSVHHLKAL